MSYLAKHAVKVFCIIVISFAACVENQNESETARLIKELQYDDAETRPDPKNIPYSHPLSNSKINGKIPLYEVQKFNDGLAIAAGDSIHISEDGEEFHSTGLIGLENRFELPSTIKPTATPPPKKKESLELSEWLKSDVAGSKEIKIQAVRSSSQPNYLSKS